MGSSYQQISEAERNQIYAYRKAGLSLSNIALFMGRNKSSISREVNRNKGLRGYRPKQAQQSSQTRQRSGNPQISDFGWSYIEHLIKLYWSPEQITGRLRHKGWNDVPSHETIYQYIYADKDSGGNIYKYLRCQKLRKKRYGSDQNRRGVIKYRNSIDERETVIENRGRIGDLEGDMIVGNNQNGYLLTYVDRKSRLTTIRHSQTKQADKVTELTIEALRGQNLHSITYDNGKEFAKHYLTAKELDLTTYFADPYSSWQRGTNENTNGLIRQFFPKKMSFEMITKQQTKVAENLLNNRPRKVLGYATPLEVQFRI